MHEMSITVSVLHTVEKICREKGINGASKIFVEADAFCGIVPDFMINCWQAVTLGTDFEGSELIIKNLPGDAECAQCGKAFTFTEPVFNCPFCGCRKLKFVPDSDVRVTQIESVC